MAKFLDECMDSWDWLDKIGYKKTTTNYISLSDLEEMRDEDYNLQQYWDYPLSETDYLVNNDNFDEATFVLVKFADSEYRWCEI